MRSDSRGRGRKRKMNFGIQQDARFTHNTITHPKDTTWRENNSTIA